VDDRNSFRITQDSANNDVIYSNQVRFEIKKNNNATLKSKKRPKESLTEAKSRTNYKMATK
jgi:hypothetical protein